MLLSLRAGRGTGNVTVIGKVWLRGWTTIFTMIVPFGVELTGLDWKETVAVSPDFNTFLSGVMVSPSIGGNWISKVTCPGRLFETFTSPLAGSKLLRLTTVALTRTWFNSSEGDTLLKLASFFWASSGSFSSRITAFPKGVSKTFSWR